jgi:hypothetical protein
MGWLPIDRVFIAPCCNTWKVPLRLTSLSQDTRSTSGFLMARVPIFTKRDEAFAYYTIEFRNAVGFDKGLTNLGEGNSGVVIHRVNETEQGNWLLYGRFPYAKVPFTWCK